MKEIFRRAAGRYRAWPNFYYYARCKLWLDPVYAVVVKMLQDSTRPLLDLGCGMGLLGVCLREAGHRGPLAGIEMDGKKIALAKQVLGADGAEFQTGNALDFPPHSGDVVVLDLLHYFNDGEQQLFLAKVAAAVAPGGMAVIREAVREAGWRYTATRIEEWFITASGWIPINGWNFPTKEQVSRAFPETEFTREIRPLWGLTPFNGYLFVFRRKEG